MKHDMTQLTRLLQHDKPVCGLFSPMVGDGRPAMNEVFGRMITAHSSSADS